MTARRLPPIALSLVVPAFNEEQRIGATMDALTRFLPSLGCSWEVRVVDDGSTDRTREIVAAKATACPEIVLQPESHRGKGAAVRVGMLAARGAVRFMCDADLSMPIEELRRFTPLVPDSFDIVIGSREGIGARRVGEPAYRHRMGRVFNGLVRRVAIGGISDTQCGFKLFSARAAQAVFSRLTIDGWAFDIEALTIARRHRLRIHELPIEWHYREFSRVSPVRDSLRMSRDVLRIGLAAMRGRYDPDPSMPQDSDPN